MKKVFLLSAMITSLICSHLNAVNHFVVLGVERTADSQAIEQEYEQHSRELAGFKLTNLQRTLMQQELDHARDVLIDESQRQQFDQAYKTDQRIGIFNIKTNPIAIESEDAYFTKKPMCAVGVYLQSAPQKTQTLLLTMPRESATLDNANLVISQACAVAGVSSYEVVTFTHDDNDTFSFSQNAHEDPVANGWQAMNEYISDIAQTDQPAVIVFTNLSPQLCQGARKGAMLYLHHAIKDESNDNITFIGINESATLTPSNIGDLAHSFDLIMSKNRYSFSHDADNVLTQQVEPEAFARAQEEAERQARTEAGATRARASTTTTQTIQTGSTGKTPVRPDRPTVAKSRPNTEAGITSGQVQRGRGQQIRFRAQPRGGYHRGSGRMRPGVARQYPGQG